jgi:cyclic beta-1,2-glucan synthetase
MYRLGVEAILGLRRVGRALRITPCIPKNWSGFDLAYRDGETRYQVRVDNPQGVSRSIQWITLDGEILPAGEIPLTGDGQRHQVCVLMGEGNAP